MVTVLTAVLVTFQELFNRANKIKHMKTVMPVFKRQIDKSPTMRTLVPVQFKWNKSEVPFLEGGRQQDSFCPVGGEH